MIVTSFIIDDDFAPIDPLMIGIFVSIDEVTFVLKLNKAIAS